ncbi:hypothetical protein JCM10213v2_004199 [Rhodosporidiobolus nylandii]
MLTRFASSQIMPPKAVRVDMRAQTAFDAVFPSTSCIHHYANLLSPTFAFDPATDGSQIRSSCKTLLENDPAALNKPLKASALFAGSPATAKGKADPFSTWTLLKVWRAAEEAHPNEFEVQFGETDTHTQGGWPWLGRNESIAAINLLAGIYKARVAQHPSDCKGLLAIMRTQFFQLDVPSCEGIDMGQSGTAGLSRYSIRLPSSQSTIDLSVFQIASRLADQAGSAWPKTVVPAHATKTIMGGEAGFFFDGVKGVPQPVLDEIKYRLLLHWHLSDKTLTGGAICEIAAANAVILGQKTDMPVKINKGVEGKYDLKTDLAWEIAGLAFEVRMNGTKDEPAPKKAALGWKDANNMQNVQLQLRLREDAKAMYKDISTNYPNPSKLLLSPPPPASATLLQNPAFQALEDIHVLGDELRHTAHLSKQDQENLTADDYSNLFHAHGSLVGCAIPSCDMNLDKKSKEGNPLKLGLINKFFPNPLDSTESLCGYHVDLAIVFKFCGLSNSAFRAEFLVTGTKAGGFHLLATRLEVPPPNSFFGIATACARARGSSRAKLGVQLKKDLDGMEKAAEVQIIETGTVDCTRLNSRITRRDKSIEYLDEKGQRVCGKHFASNPYKGMLLTPLSSDEVREIVKSLSQNATVQGVNNIARNFRKVGVSPGTLLRGLVSHRALPKIMRETQANKVKALLAQYSGREEE